MKTLNRVREREYYDFMRLFTTASIRSIGRHSVASQAATGGESIKAVQAQLGHRSEQSTHKYAHLGSQAQLHVMESLTPFAPPHVVRPTVQTDASQVMN